jgi:hypothetical protein
VNSTRLLVCAALLLGACDDDSNFEMDLSGGVNTDAGMLTQFDLACGSASSRAELVPVSLVFVLDRSGSMGDGINGDRTLKWDPVTEALAAFFGDAQSMGVQASLVFFPYAMNPAERCNPSAYYAADVQMRALPDPLTFKGAMQGTSPSGNTPTRPAILGAIDYAKDQAMLNPKRRHAIVLVTDGEPDDCNSSVANVSLEVAKVAGTIPTYVVGVGGALAMLNMIAQSGGTGAPTFITVGDAAKTKSEFLNALNAIRGLEVSCNLPVPSPPAGQTFVRDQVNVVYTPGTGAPSQLLYDKDCSSGFGWRYDDEANPKTIELCATSCANAKADKMARIDVVLGCITAGDPIL